MNEGSSWSYAFYVVKPIRFSGVLDVLPLTLAAFSIKEAVVCFCFSRSYNFMLLSLLDS